ASPGDGRMSSGGKTASAGRTQAESSNSARAELRSLREPMAETIFVSLAMAVPLPLSGHMVMVPIIAAGGIGDREEPHVARRTSNEISDDGVTEWRCRCFVSVGAHVIEY